MADAANRLAKLTTASVYYAVGYSKPRGIGFDIGEFDSFGDAVAAAIEYGAWPTEVIDAAEMTFKIGEDGEIIWIQRWKNGRAE